MQASEVQTIRNFRKRRYSKLNLVKFAHIVSYLRNILSALVLGLTCKCKELTNDTRKPVDAMNDNFKFLPIAAVEFGDIGSLDENCWEIAEMPVSLLVNAPVPVLVVAEGA